MRALHSVVLLAVVAAVGSISWRTASGQSQTLSPARAAAVSDAVRAFMGTVAHDITQDGPLAWNKHFADDPAFFMADEGRLVFPDRATETAAIQEFARGVKHIELTWGEDLRVDPLTESYAVVGATYHENRVDTKGERVEETGFFTGTVELRDGRWQFRNAHWSLIAPSPASPPAQAQAPAR
ncbi:MAG: hypothetical protein ACRD59_07470 [Candidatus Acidiferrales bacterium]